MNPAEFENLVNRRHRTLGIICAALVASVLVYGVVAWIVVTQGGLKMDEALNGVPMLPYILAALGLGALGVAPVISSMVMNRSGEGGPAADTEPVLQRYQSSVIVGFAVRESAAILGLVATFLTGEVIWTAALGAAAILAMLVAWPRRDTMLDLVRSGSMPT